MKKQIGVIFGSRSCEREVSIISAIQLMRAADYEKYDIIPVSLLYEKATICSPPEKTFPCALVVMST